MAAKVSEKWLSVRYATRTKEKGALICGRNLKKFPLLQFVQPAVRKNAHHTNRDLSSGEVEAIRGQIRFQPVSVKRDRVEAEKSFQP
jgi:hypothetical protein